MKNLLACLLILVIFCIINLSCESSPTESTETASITVFVNEDDGPVTGAEIFIQTMDKSWATDENGKAVISGLDQKRYIVTAEHPNGLHLTKGLTISDEPELTFTFSYSALSLTVLDAGDNPVEGATVRTVPPTEETTTDELGTIHLDPIFARSYDVIVSYEGRDVFSETVIVAADSLRNVECIIFSNFSFVVKSDAGRALRNSIVTTDPPTQTMTTDYAGFAQIDNVLTGEYQLIVIKNDVTVLTETVDITPGNMETFDLLYNEQPPTVLIKSPVDNTFAQAPFYLKGSATDIEDVSFKDEKFVWKSDISGVIGEGKELICDRILLGWHRISLEVTDSDGTVGTSTIMVNVVKDNMEDSYFPTMISTRWEYLHPRRVYTTSSEDGDEIWDLSTILVTIISNGSRVTRMEYNCKVGKREKKYSYVVRDYLLHDGTNIYISKTFESILVDNKYSSSSFNITSEYSKPYLIVENHQELTPGTVFLNDVLVTMIWHKNFHYDEFKEQFHRQSEASVGEEESVSTPLGQMTATPMTISSDGSFRTWWLVRGVGIVKMEYNMFEQNPVAELFKSNLVDAGKAAFRKAPPLTNAVHYEPVEKYDKSTDPVPQDIRTLLDVSRSLLLR